MKYMTDTLDFQLEKRSVVTLGKFDGLHRVTRDCCREFWKWEKRGTKLWYLPLMCRLWLN